jgi:hypothetical protein
MSRIEPHNVPVAVMVESRSNRVLQGFKISTSGRLDCNPFEKSTIYKIKSFRTVQFKSG